MNYDDNPVPFNKQFSDGKCLGWFIQRIKSSDIFFEGII